jgi:hypothetical protein
VPVTHRHITLGHTFLQLTPVDCEEASRLDPAVFSGGATAFVVLFAGSPLHRVASTR